YRLGFQILDGARDLRADETDRLDADTASRIVWLDGLVMNPDRTAQNPNILMWRGLPWMVDHGAALGFQHNWRSVTEDSPRRNTFDFPRHLLFERATQIAEMDELLALELDREVIRGAVEEVPEDFLFPLLKPTVTLDAIIRRREAYVAFLWKRLKAPRPFILFISSAC